jgi:hypothetical protein
MSAPQTLVQAALNRLAARLGGGLADAAAGLAVLAQEAPERLQREWDLFREEVELEARRLDHPEADAHGVVAEPDTAPPSADPQQQIDSLRAQVAQVARRLEDQT